MKVVYGHTDSIYVQMPMESTEEVLALLNNHVRNLFPNILNLEQHPVTIEFEKYYESLGVGITKNRNAGLISWKDGEYLNEPEFVMTGFTAKRRTITKLDKEIQTKILKMWVGQSSEKEITNFLKKKYNDILKGKIELDMLINRTRYRTERFTYKCLDCDKTYSVDKLLELRKNVKGILRCSKKDCLSSLILVTTEGKRPTVSSGVEGVLWYNQNVGTINDSYLYLKVEDVFSRPNYMNPITGVSKRPSYISAPTLDELKEYKPDYKHYAESIVKKAKPIYNAMGWDLDEIKKDENQKTLDEWW